MIRHKQLIIVGGFLIVIIIAYIGGIFIPNFCQRGDRARKTKNKMANLKLKDDFYINKVYTIFLKYSQKNYNYFKNNKIENSPVIKLTFSIYKYYLLDKDFDIITETLDYYEKKNINIYLYFDYLGYIFSKMKKNKNITQKEFENNIIYQLYHKEIFNNIIKNNSNAFEIFLIWDSKADGCFKEDTSEYLFKLFDEYPKIVINHWQLIKQYKVSLASTDISNKKQVIIEKYLALKTLKNNDVINEIVTWLQQY